MTFVRRHDLYVLKTFLGALAAALLFLTTIVVVYDLADRLDRVIDAARSTRAGGGSATGLVLAYYGTLIPFLWLKILPFAVLLSAALTVTWLGRHGELVPLVGAGVSSRRVVAPILVAAALIAVAQATARETVVPELSRRHHDLHRQITIRRAERLGRFTDVPHVMDRGGGRLSMAAYVPSSRRIERAWVTFAKDSAAGGARTAYRYPELLWDESAARWRAPRGGDRRTLDDGVATAVATRTLSPDDPVPIEMDPGLLELTVRQDAVLGMSSDEIATLARANPENVRLVLLLHQQGAAPLATFLLPLLGLPLAFRLSRRRRAGAFLGILGVVVAYQLTDAVATDLGSRGALDPVFAAWFAHVVFGALGVTLLAGMET